MQHKAKGKFFFKKLCLLEMFHTSPPVLWLTVLKHLADYQMFRFFSQSHINAGKVNVVCRLMPDPKMLQHYDGGL